jgi:hypothetical protein
VSKVSARCLLSFVATRLMSSICPASKFFIGTRLAPDGTKKSRSVSVLPSASGYSFSAIALETSGWIGVSEEEGTTSLCTVMQP